MSAVQALAKLVTEGSDQHYELVVVNGEILIGLAHAMKLLV
jgi:hypothetical protein